MNIAIIGAGFTGLSAAYTLQKHGHTITIFEKDELPGGLAIGYKEKKWNWTLEKHYHHWFTNDHAVLRLAKEIGHNVVIERPHTNWYVGGNIYEFDSLTSALRFPPLSLIERLRNLATIGILRINPYWKPLEKVNAVTFLPKLMGKKVYELLWEPLFINKFGKYASNISLAWFWARIKKRTPSLAYPEGGFLSFATHLAKTIVENNGKILYKTELSLLTEEKNKTIRVHYKIQDGESREKIFDKVIITLPSSLFAKLAPSLPESYKKTLTSLKTIGATNLVLRLNKPFFADGTYWLSVADKKSPIMAIVEHTNFMNKKHYHNEHIVYLGNYLPTDHANFQKSKEELLVLYDPYLKKINKNYKKNLITYELFRAPFAQPIIPTHYSTKIPPLTTPISHIFLANMQQVYPWDRGTNYAVELGQKVAKLVNTTS